MAGLKITPCIWQTGNDGGLTDTSYNLQQDGGEPLHLEYIHPGEAPCIMLDFGKKVTGYLVIETSAHSKDIFHMKYGPTADCLILPLAADMPETGRYVSDHYVTCRYIRLSLYSLAMQACCCFADIQAIYMLSSQYPVSRTGSFTCDDEDLSLVYKRGSYTLELCMQKYSESCCYRQIHRPEFIDVMSRTWKGKYSDYVMFDAPRRDREVWLGDIRVENLLAMSAFGAYDVAKNSLCLFSDLQRKDGLVPGCGSSQLDFIEYGFWGIIAVWECYLYSGDREFLSHMHPFIKNLIEYVDSNHDERGFLAGDGNWMWTLPREGFNAGLQMILARSLECAALIERELYDRGEAARLDEMAVSVQKQIDKEFWDETRGVYTDRLRIVTTSMPVPLDINCYAVVFGIAGPERSVRILDYLKEHMWTQAGSSTIDYKVTDARLEDNLVKYPLIGEIQSSPDPAAALVRLMTPHNKMIWPFINAYEVQARFMAGDTENAFELIRRCWDRSRFEETGTYWEIVDPNNPVFNFGSCYPTPKDDCHNSAAHGWSGWVAHILQTEVLGIKPTAPGFRRVSIVPQTGFLGDVRGTVPTPHGNIEVCIHKDNQTYQLTYTVPEGVEADVCVGESEHAGRKLKIDKQAQKEGEQL